MHTVSSIQLKFWSMYRPRYYTYISSIDGAYAHVQYACAYRVKVSKHFLNQRMHICVVKCMYAMCAHACLCVQV